MDTRLVSLLASRFSLLTTLVIGGLSFGLAFGAIQDRKTDPLVIRATQAKFPLFVDTGVDASAIEVFVYENNAWHPVAYQVDELSPDPTPYKLIPYDARQCNTVGADLVPENALCEFHYDLRRTSQPSGEFTTNDELVVLAGSAGDCDVSLTKWAGAGLGQYRYQIMVSDSGESGCFYLFRRTGGHRPAVPDLIEYDIDGDNTSHEGGCRPFTGPNADIPTPEACGAVIAPAVDIDRDNSTDTPAWRWDYLGNWTVDKWFIGETTIAAPSQDLVDLIKWRIDSPPETEGLWDLRDGDGIGCATFHGFIDGSVRIIRVVGGSASGVSTTKYEFAYPNKITTRVNLRVHPVSGPVYSYPDLMEANVSPGADNDPETSCTTCAVVYEHDENGTSYTELDEVDGLIPDPAPSYVYRKPYQVSSDKGSFLMDYGVWRLADTTTTGANYNDQEANLWTHQGQTANEYHEEGGDKGVARSTFGDVCETQNLLECFADREGYGVEVDKMLAVIEHDYVMLSTTKAASSIGEEYLVDQARGVFSLAIREELLDAEPLPVPVTPCIPLLTLLYDNDGGEVGFDASASGCPGIVGWNLYQAIGLGQFERLSSLPLADSFSQADLALNETRTYYATAVGHDGSEGPMTQGISILHNDIVPPLPPSALIAEVTGSSITISWDLPPEPNISQTKVWASQASGSPYFLAASESGCATESTFSASSGTYYLVVTAVDVAGNESAYSEELTVVVP